MYCSTTESHWTDNVDTSIMNKSCSNCTLQQIKTRERHFSFVFFSSNHVPVLKYCLRLPAKSLLAHLKVVWRSTTLRRLASLFNTCNYTYYCKRLRKTALQNIPNYFQLILISATVSKICVNKEIVTLSLIYRYFIWNDCLVNIGS